MKTVHLNCMVFIISLLVMFVSCFTRGVLAAPSAKLQAALSSSGIGQAGSEPSPQLQALLNKQSAAVQQHSLDAFSALREVMRRALDPGVSMKTGFEYEADASYPAIKEDLPAGTLRQQLERIAKISGHTLQANGDWVNFIPKAKANDPNYVMNRRIAGKVVLSREPGKSTSVSEWMTSQRIISVRHVKELKLIPPPSFKLPSIATPKMPEQIALENPTLREYFNAHSALYGEDMWTAKINEDLTIPGEATPRIYILGSGGYSGATP